MPEILEWTSLPEVAHATDGAVVVDTSCFPSGLDLERICMRGALLRSVVVSMGGYESMSIAGHSGSETQVSSAILSSSGGDTATGIRSGGITVAESSSFSDDQDKLKHFLALRSGHLKVDWNTNDPPMSAIRRKLVQWQVVQPEHVAPSDKVTPSFVARQMDLSIRGQATKAIARHSVDLSGLPNAFFLGAENMLAVGAVTFASLDNQELAGANAAAIGLLHAFNRLYVTALGYDPREYLLDVLPRGRYMRLGLAAGVLSSSQLVKSFDQV